MRERDIVTKLASELIDGERQSDYGEAVANFSAIAAMWSVIFGVNVTPEQVARAMICLKLCRLKASPAKSDSWVDIAGYAALGYEVACATYGETIRERSRRAAEGAAKEKAQEKEIPPEAAASGKA